MKIPGGYRISTPAAVVLIVSFFMPWLTVSCAGQPVGRFSGLNLAQGFAEMGGAMPDLFLIPLAGVLAILLVFLSAKRDGIEFLWDIVALGALAMLPLLVLAIRFYGSREQAASVGFDVHFEIGFWGVLLGLLGLMGGSAWNWWEYRSMHQQPVFAAQFGASSSPPLPQPLPPPPIDPSANQLGPTEIPPTRIPRPSSHQAELVALNGPVEGRRFLLETDNILIGRSSQCNIQIMDPSISRVHARLRFYQGQWFIQDQQSSAGIMLNGKKVLAGPLQTGDIIQLGETRLRFSFG